MAALGWLTGCAAVLMMAAFVSIVIEWLGLVTVWTIDHSRGLLEVHWQYLDAQGQGWIMALSQWLDVSVTIPAVLAPLSAPVSVGLEAAGNVLIVLTIRLILLALVVPRLALYVVVALIWGTTLREIRKLSGGREYGYRFHYLKRWLGPSLATLILAYLACPMSWHPNVFLLPLIAVAAASALFLSATFKKYL